MVLRVKLSSAKDKQGMIWTSTGWLGNTRKELRPQIIYQDYQVDLRTSIGHQMEPRCTNNDPAALKTLSTYLASIRH